MAFRFCDSFDHYATANVGLKYSTVNYPGGLGSVPIQIVSGGRLHNCLRISPILLSSIYVTKVLDAQPTWVLGFALSFSSTPNVQASIVALNDGGSRQVDLSVDTSGHLIISRNGTTLATSSNTLTFNGFNYVEWKMSISSSIAASSCVLRVNGNVWITLTTGANTKNTSNATADTIVLGDLYGNNANYNIFLDDLYVLDGTGSSNNDFIGDITVEATYPTGDGNYTAFTASGAASRYLAVNETLIDGDTTYVFSNTTNDRDSFTFNAPTNTVITCYGVQMILGAKKQGSGSRTIAPMFRASSTNYDGTAQSINSSYNFYLQAYSTNPATSVAWTATDLNSIEAGIKVVS